MIKFIIVFLWISCAAFCSEVSDKDMAIKMAKAFSFTPASGNIFGCICIKKDKMGVAKVTGGVVLSPTQLIGVSKAFGGGGEACFMLALNKTDSRYEFNIELRDWKVDVIQPFNTDKTSIKIDSITGDQVLALWKTFDKSGNEYLLASFLLCNPELPVR